MLFRIVKKKKKIEKKKKINHQIEQKIASVRLKVSKTQAKLWSVGT